jgi:hypothetical protein
MADEKPFSALVQDMLMSVVRKGLVMLGTYIMATGAVSDNEWTNVAAGLAPVIVGVVWSLVNKVKPGVGASV